MAGREMNLDGHITSKRFKGGEYVTIKFLASFWLFLFKEIVQNYSKCHPCFSHKNSHLELSKSFY